MDVIISADTPLLTILLQGTPLVWYASYLSSGISARRGYQTRKTEKSLHKRSKNLQKFFNQQNLFCVLFSLTFKSPNKLQDEVTVNSSLGVKFPQSEQLEREREREREITMNIFLCRNLCDKEIARKKLLFSGKKLKDFFSVSTWDMNEPDRTPLPGATGTHKRTVADIRGATSKISSKPFTFQQNKRMQRGCPEWATNLILCPLGLDFGFSGTGHPPDQDAGSTWGHKSRIRTNDERTSQYTCWPLLKTSTS